MRYAFVVLAACSSEHASTINGYTIDALPVTEWTAGLPVSGDGGLLVWISRSDWSNAIGIVRFRCDGCTLGDDRAKLMLPALFEDGIHGVDFGHVTFDTVRADLDFGDGKLHMTAQWRSPDLELDAVIDGVLAARAEDIELTGCVTFRTTPALFARDPKTHAVISLTGAPQGDRGRYTIAIEGTLGKMLRLGKVCSLQP